MKKKIAFLGATALTVAMPLIASAQDLAAQCAAVGNDGKFTGILCTIYRLVKIIIPLMILGAVAYFIWSVVKFIQADAEGKEKARDGMIQSIIGFVVILGLWGIVTIVLSTFGVGGGSVNQAAFPTF